jgi:transmembrane sensor
MALASVMLSTQAEPRSVLLDDGTRVNLAPASEVEVHLEQKARLARVRKGRARFKVKPDQRPFVIVAGDRQVTVDEGVYDAEVRGRVGAVRSAASGTAADAPDAADRPDVVRANATGGQPLLEFRAEPLARVVQRINGLHGSPPIEIGPGIANLPVTGIFQTGGSQALAASLAAAFDLNLTRTGSGTLRLERKNR